MTLRTTTLRTNVLGKQEAGGICLHTEGLGPSASPDSDDTILVGYTNDWEDGVFCWHHYDYVYRGGVRFDLGDVFYVNPDDILSVRLYFFTSGVLGRSSDGEAERGSDAGCGAGGDELLVPSDHGWWFNDQSGSAVAPRTFDNPVEGYGYHGLYLWITQGYAGEDPNPLGWLATGPPAGMDHLNPTLGVLGMDARSLLLAWLGSGPPGANAGFILRNTELEGMAEDHSACLMEYHSFRLEVVYVVHST